MQLPNNIAFAVATVFAPAVSVTAITNASEAVATVDADGISTGDFLEFTSGWSKANGRVFRAKAVTETAVTLEGLDTSDTNLFSVGMGTGSLRKITTWVPIVNVSSAEITGGDPKTVEVALLDSDMPVMLPDGFSATSVTLTIVDEKTLPHHAALKAISEGQKLTCLRGTLPNGSVLLYAGYCGFNETPSMTKSNVMAVKATFSLQNKVVRY